MNVVTYFRAHAMHSTQAAVELAQTTGGKDSKHYDFACALITGKQASAGLKLQRITSDIHQKNFQAARLTFDSYTCKSEWNHLVGQIGQVDTSGLMGGPKVVNAKMQVWSNELQQLIIKKAEVESSQDKYQRLNKKLDKPVSCSANEVPHFSEYKNHRPSAVSTAGGHDVDNSSRAASESNSDSLKVDLNNLEAFN